jgi:hypothetical protein
MEFSSVASKAERKVFSMVVKKVAKKVPKSADVTAGEKAVK